ncbi:MAG: hypothetical protein ACRDUA_23580 [Micromonosporaceae bacterium]
MATVLLDIVISLDGLICEPGGADGGLHDWYFNPSEVSGPIVDGWSAQPGRSSSAEAPSPPATPQAAGTTPHTRCPTSW